MSSSKPQKNKPNVGEQAGKKIGKAGGEKVGAAVGARFGGPIGASIGKKIGGKIGSKLGAKVGKKISMSKLPSTRFSPMAQMKKFSSMGIKPPKPTTGEAPSMDLGSQAMPTPP